VKRDLFSVLLRQLTSDVTYIITYFINTLFHYHFPFFGAFPQECSICGIPSKIPACKSPLTTLMKGRLIPYKKAPFYLFMMPHEECQCHEKSHYSPEGGRVLPIKDPVETKHHFISLLLKRWQVLFPLPCFAPRSFVQCARRE